MSSSINITNRKPTRPKRVATAPRRTPKSLPHRSPVRNRSTEAPTQRRWKRILPWKSAQEELEDLVKNKLPKEKQRKISEDHFAESPSSIITDYFSSVQNPKIAESRLDQPLFPPLIKTYTDNEINTRLKLPSSFNDITEREFYQPFRLLMIQDDVSPSMSLETSKSPQNFPTPSTVQDSTPTTEIAAPMKSLVVNLVRLPPESLPSSVSIKTHRRRRPRDRQRRRLRVRLPGGKEFRRKV